MDAVADVVDPAAERLARVGSRRDGRWLTERDEVQVALEDVTDDPYDRWVGHRDDPRRGRLLDVPFGLLALDDGTADRRDDRHASVERRGIPVRPDAEDAQRFGRARHPRPRF